MTYVKRYKLKKEDDILLNSLRDATVKCKKCGRSVVIARKNKALCPDCGYYVFRDDKEEFKQRLMEKLGKKNE